ncbi:X-ray repair cross-complementing protein 5 [Chytriomyces hyalinus]|nr:X-ray repair cross-complementing protein 5 [Chytriomyces hyalinus]
MATLDMLKYVSDGCEKGDNAGDILDGIVVAINMLETHCKKLKWTKSIFVFSDFSAQINLDNQHKITSKAESYGVKINVIGFGFKDDPPPESDTSQRAQNERFMRTFSESTEGQVFSASEALSLLGELRSRSVKPTTLIRHILTLGDPSVAADSSIAIFVWAYAKVKEAKLPSAKKWSRVAADAVDVAQEAFKGDVMMERTYKVKDQNVGDADDELAAGSTELQKEDLIRAYKYGKDLIPFADEDREAMKLTSMKGFSILGFVKSSEVSRELFINDPIQMVPDPDSLSQSKRLFETLALSMQAKDVYALVRYVRIDNASPKLGVLIPHIGKKIWCAWMQIPFKEDVREYSFTTLCPLLLNPGPSTQTQTFRATSSASLASQTLSQGSLAGSGESKRRKLNHRLVDTAEADRRLDKFIDDMDLMNAIEDDGEFTEAYKPADVFNPGYQRMYQCIAHRAMNPDDEDLPALDPRFVAGVLPMPELVERAKRSLEEVKSAFQITKIEVNKETNKAIFKKNLEKASEMERLLAEAAAGTAEGSSSNALDTSFQQVSGDLIESVGTADPIHDFKAIVSRSSTSANASESSALISIAMNQMSDRIISFVKESFGSQFYTKAISCIIALRDESVSRQVCKRYNELMMDLKRMCKDAVQVDAYKAFWDTLVSKGVSGGVGLITKDEVGGGESEYNRDDAIEFYASTAPSAPASMAVDEVAEVDEQDLIDMLD